MRATALQLHNHKGDQTMTNLTNEQITLFTDLAKDHNENIDHFVKVTLKEHFGSETITASQWFEAQRLIRQQNFYKRGYAILKVLRSFGIDCKMDMQSDKLHCPEINLFAY